jgi:hypothetical protein
MLQGMQNERVWGAVIDEESGRMSATTGEADGAFVNHEGIVYQKDLGPSTAALAGAMKQFDPDAGWKTA